MKEKSVALFTLSECCEKEEEFRSFFSKILSENELSLIKFSSNSIPQMVKEAKDAEKVFIVYDAKEGMNRNFSHVVSEMYKQEIRPIQIVTEVDDEDANVAYAKRAVAEIWCIEDPSAEAYELDFDNLYFSYKKMSFDTVPEITQEKDVDALIRVLKA